MACKTVARIANIEARLDSLDVMLILLCGKAGITKAEIVDGMVTLALEQAAYDDPLIEPESSSTVQ